MAKIVFDEKPGELYDIFHSLWVINNYEYVKQKKQEQIREGEADGEYKNEYDELLEDIIENDKVDKEKISRYFHKELKFSRIFLFDIWKYPTLNSYLNHINNLSEFEIRKRIVQTIFEITGEEQDENDSKYEKNAYDKDSVLRLINDKKIPSSLKWEMFLLLNNGKKYIEEYAQFIEEYMETYNRLNDIRGEIIDGLNQYLKKNIDCGGVDFLNELTHNIFDLKEFDEIFVMTTATMNLLIVSEGTNTCFLGVGLNTYDDIRNITEKNQFEKNLDFMRNICESTRFSIIKLLLDGDYYGQEIGDKVGLSRPNVSYHMNFLIESGVVSVEKDGQRIYYHLNKEKLRDSIKFLEKELKL